MFTFLEAGCTLVLIMFHNRNWQQLFQLVMHKITVHSMIGGILDLIKYGKFVGTKKCLGKGAAPHITSTEHPDPSTAVQSGRRGASHPHNDVRTSAWQLIFPLISGKIVSQKRLP